MAALRRSETCGAKDTRNDRFPIELYPSFTHYERRLLGGLKYVKQETRETTDFLMSLIPLSLGPLAGLKHAKQEPRETTDFLVGIIPMHGEKL